MSSTKFYFWTIRLFYKCPWMGKYVFFKKNSSVKKHKKEINLPQNCFNRFGRLEIGLFLFRCGGGGKCVKRLRERAEYVSQSRAIGGRMGGPFSTSFWLTIESLLTEEVSLYGWPPVLPVWNCVALLMLKNNRFICLVESNPSKQDVSCTVIHSL